MIKLDIEDCIETYPCSHLCDVMLHDGEIDYLVLLHQYEIKEMYDKYTTLECPEHFNY